MIILIELYVFHLSIYLPLTHIHTHTQTRKSKIQLTHTPVHHSRDIEIVKLIQAHPSP